MADVDPDSTPGLKGGTGKALRDAKKQRDELFELHERLYAERKRSMLVVLQGMDTSGKDGTVTHVVRNFNPQGVLITPFKAPTPEERRRGFQDPTKRWKFNPHDIDERARWDDYMSAYSLAITNCSTPTAPWYVIPADDKAYRNWAVSHILVETLREMDPKYAQPKLDIPRLKKRLRS